MLLPVTVLVADALTSNLFWLQMLLPVTVLVTDGDTREFNLFNIVNCDSCVGFIFQKNCNSTSNLSHEKHNGNNNHGEPQDSERNNKK